jgi:hypothetical protein
MLRGVVTQQHGEQGEADQGAGDDGERHSRSAALREQLPHS